MCSDHNQKVCVFRSTRVYSSKNTNFLQVGIHYITRINKQSKTRDLRLKKEG